MSATESRGEHSERLRSLLDDARAAGDLGALAPALELAADEARNLQSTKASNQHFPIRHGMLGEADCMQAVFQLIERAAPSGVPILILGETGTGKELAARAIHDASKRRSKPFLAENCAAVPANLLESELFGHKRGSFSGAIRDRKGLFQSADGGTVFLDEIGDMPLQMQSKLLRVLEQGELRAVGSNKVIQVDVRILAATHRNLTQMVASKTFREDLFYRLNVVCLSLPPLRERGADIGLLVNFFLSKNGDRKLAPGSMELLMAAPWPGNIRQLENEITRACALTAGALQPRDLSPEIQKPAG